MQKYIITIFLHLQYILHCRLQCLFSVRFAILYILQEVLHMSFQLKENKKETENKTIRFPIPLIDRIENAIQNQDVTFSSFVLQACEYALNNMENKKTDK